MQSNTVNGVAVRTIDDNPIDYNVDKGWKITLEASGTQPAERSVTNPFAFGSIVFFNTMTPSSAICDDGGDGWLMAVDLFNGGVPDFQPIDVNGDGMFDINDKVGGSVTTVGTKTSGIPTESRFISNKRVTANSDGSIAFENIQHSSPFAPRRMSWTGLER
jgi:type IV pilus assembly protein PilY1